MWNFEIGLSGLDAARQGLDVIGNNIANAASEGYHRQKVDLTPEFARQDAGRLLGGGVSIEGVSRMLDSLLEAEILRQQSATGQVSQEAGTLQSVEAAFGELTGGTGLNAAIDNFFNALKDLSAHPDQADYQNKVLAAGDAMAARFRTLGSFLVDLQSQIKLRAENIIDQIDSYAAQVADLNDHIQRIEMSGGKSSNLLDQRDQLIKQMAQLAGVETQQRDFGVVDVDVCGIQIVSGASSMQLEAGLNENLQLGVTPEGAFVYHTSIDGGQLGGLITLYNTTIHDIQSDLDTLARTIINQVNQYHVEGVGADGSFTEIAGDMMVSASVSDFDPPVIDGSFFIRFTYTDPDTGEITISRHEIEVDPAADTLTTVAAAISGVTGLSATVSGNRLSIAADTNYKFDFLPAVLSEPTASSLTAASPPTVSVSGVYTGDTNQTFTFTAVGAGTVGNGTLQLEVRDEDNNLVGTLNIGAGYAAGDELELENGIKIALSADNLNNGDSFEVAAFADTDTSGFLSAAGINTFFTGNSASDMSISSNVADSPGRIATALGADMHDNTNASRLAAISELESSDLGSMTAGEFYRRLVSDIGQQLSMKQTEQTNIEDLVQTLTNQQSEISGVDINEEAAQMLVFEQMFQATAKYLTTVQSTLSTLLDLI